jgi:hypothetical protein
MRNDNSLEKHNHDGKDTQEKKSRKTTNEIDRGGGIININEPCCTL